MNLQQVTVELRNAEPMKLFQPHMELYHSLTGKELPEKEAMLPGFQLNIKDKLMIIVVGPERTSIVLGETPNISYCIDNTIAIFKKISEVVKFPPILRLGIRSFWIKESKATFVKLVSFQKQLLYKNVSVANEAIDIAGSFILSDDGYKANIQFGPMERTQLQSTLLFPPSGLPEVVTFIDVDYFKEMERGEATAGLLRDFVRRGLEYANKQSQELANNLQIQEED
jgi:hypothetical protein